MSTETEQHGRDEVAHRIHIIINGQKKTVTSHENTFDEIVAIAYDHNAPEGDNWSFSITYRGGGQRDGSLTPGGTVKLAEGMIFNVRATDKS